MQKCGIEYPTTPEFWYRMKSMSDGLQTQCKACLKAYDQWRTNHKDEYEAQLKAKRALLDQGIQPCTKCGEVKPFSEFYRGSKKHGRKSGYHSACKACYAKAMGWEHMPRKQYPEPPEGYKYCTKCDQLKLVADFYTGSERVDGLTSRCSACLIEQGENRRISKGVKVREKLPDGYKRCARCKQVKLKSEDNFNHTRGIWWSAYCKPCLGDWREENRVRLRPQKVLNVAKRRA